MKKYIYLFMSVTLFITLFVQIGYSQKLFEGYWTTTSTSKGSIPGQPAERVDNQKTFYKTGKMKVVNLDKNEIMIFRFDKGLVWNIDKTKSIYTEMRFDDMQKGMQDARSQMAEEMKNMSAEEKQMMEKMMGKKMGALFGSDSGPKIDIQETNEKKTINGYRCKKYVYLIDNDPFVDLWMTDKFQLGTDFLKLYDQMGMTKSDISEKAKNIKGFPIQTYMNMKTGFGSIETTSIVNKIVTQKISDSEFELPKDLKKQEMPMFPRAM